MFHVPSVPRHPHLLLVLFVGLLPFASVAWAEPLTVRDDLGRTLHFSKPPERIVSISSGLTEILFALGLDDAIVGVSDFCNYPRAALARPKIGGVNPNIEAIVALRPDLVVSTGGVAMRETARQLERFGIPMMGLEFGSVEAVLERITMLGNVTGRRESAAAVVAGLRHRLEAVLARRSTDRPPRVLYLLDEEPYITIGPKSFLYDVLVKAGGRPFETGSDESYPRVGLETIIRFDPEVILFSNESDRVPEERIAAWQRWSRITAVRTGRLYSIPRDLLNRPGPRIIDAIELVASQLQEIHEDLNAAP